MAVSRIQAFNPSTDDVESWTSVLSNYLIASGVDKSKDDDKKKATAILLSSVGVSSYSLIKDLVSPKAPEDMVFDDLVQVLVKHYKPSPKAISERFKFYNRKQLQGESVTVFLSELRKLAVTCKFENLDISLRDQFVVGISSEAAQKRLFLEDDKLTLESAVAIATSQEAAEASTRLIRSVPGTSSEFHHQSATHKVSTKSQNNKSSSTNQAQSFQNKPKEVMEHPCRACGNKIHYKKCPALDKTCDKCHRTGHYTHLCQSKKSNFQSHNQKGRKNLNCNNIKSIYNHPIHIPVQLNGHPINIELDTGSGRTFISQSIWRKIGSPSLHNPKESFTSYSGHPVKVDGEFQCHVRYFNQEGEFPVLVTKSSALFGRDLLRAFQMDWKGIKTQLNQVNFIDSSSKLKLLLEEYKDLFHSSSGRIKDFKAKLTLKDDAVPKFFKARPVPYALREAVDAELQKMEEQGVITKIDYSEWASPLVVVPKSNGRVRITGDFKRTINNQLCINQYPLARIDDLMETIAGGSTFSKLDGSDAFHQIEVEESCKKFLIINTHRGLFRYNVLPQGIASSPAIFQEMIDCMLQGIPMSGSFVDDIISTGKTDEDHINHLREIFKRMRAANYRLSKSKCQFLQKSIKFLGSVVSQDGLRTDPEKVEAINSMKEPSNVSELKSFLGLVNFYGKFISNLSSLCEPLYALTRKDIKFQWTNQCKSAFHQVKHSVSQSGILAHFNQSTPIGIACDASSVGLGVVLFHRYSDGTEKPIAYASKSLSTAEKNYSQIEKEGLSIIFGVKKFMKYLYGRKFILITDHNPLLAIFSKNRDVPALAATRLHRWSLFLSGFTFDIEYRNTSSHGNADALSRLPLPNSEDLDEEDNNIIKRIQEDNPITLKKIRLFTSRDPVLSQVLHFIQNGWPEKQNRVPDEVKPFFSHRHEFTIQQGVILWGLRVIVPLSLRESILQQLHDTHPGIVRMKALARQFIYWPGIDSDIESLVKSCHTCAINRDNPASAPLHPWSFPERPWQRLHMDLAGHFHNNMWLIIVDAYSKWPEVIQLGNDTTSSKIIKSVRELIARFGIPDTIVTDNGPQFISEEFQSFCRGNGIRHTRSSAYHPRSNGEAERFVRTFKHGLSGSGNQNLNLALCDFLLTYRITPHATTGVSPSELILKRKPRTLLDFLRPDVESNVRQNQEKQKENDHIRTPARQFSIGQSVWIKTFSKNHPTWSLGKIIKSLGPLSYLVDVEGKSNVTSIIFTTGR